MWQEILLIIIRSKINHFKTKWSWACHFHSNIWGISTVYFCWDLCHYRSSCTFSFNGKNIGSYLVDDYYKKPVIICEYPKELKLFYARLMEDGRKVYAFDIVMPKVSKFPVYLWHQVIINNAQVLFDRQPFSGWYYCLRNSKGGKNG